MPDVPIQCSCGSLRGTVHDVNPSAGFHVTCHCQSCQAFAHHLGREDEVLDAHGATEIFQTSPARVSIEQGELACLRLTPAGLMRWHSACCRSPIANTMGAGMPFTGLVTAALDVDDALLGPIEARLWASHAHGDVSGPNAYAQVAFGQLGRLLLSIAANRLRRDHARSPFFQDGAPVAEPVVLSNEQHAALMERVAP